MSRKLDRAVDHMMQNIYDMHDNPKEWPSPFSNGASFRSWSSANCQACLLYEKDCAIDNALINACCTDGCMPQALYNRMGLDKGGDCPEKVAVKCQQASTYLRLLNVAQGHSQCQQQATECVDGNQLCSECAAKVRER